MQLADLLNEVGRLRGRGDASADLRQVGVAADLVELAAGLQFLGKNRKVDRGALVVELDEFFEDDAVGRKIKGGRTQLALKAAGDHIGAIEETAGEQIFLGFEAVRRRASDGGRHGTGGVGRCTRAAGRFLRVVSHEQSPRGNTLERDKQRRRVESFSPVVH